MLLQPLLLVSSGKQVYLQREYSCKVHSRKAAAASVIIIHLEGHPPYAQRGGFIVMKLLSNGNLIRFKFFNRNFN